MKIVYSSNVNPQMPTLSFYARNVLKKMGNDVLFFNNADYKIPGRIRSMIKPLEVLDLKRINANLLRIIKENRPDLVLEIGGTQIYPQTILEIKKLGIPVILWTIDCPRDMHDFQPIIDAAPYYNYIFTGGMEAYDILKGIGIQRLHWLPFACDPEFHYPVNLSEDEQRKYGYDVVFVGSVHSSLYADRVKILESLVEFNMGVWGPGTEDIPLHSPLKPHIKGSNTSCDIWRKIYSASKIILCMHFKPPNELVPCYQASPRVYEIMACKGFLMVDNQRDVTRLFNDKQDLTIFKDVNKLKELIRYYLNNDEERSLIAEQGYQAVLSNHTYKHRMDEIFSVLEANL